MTGYYIYVNDVDNLECKGCEGLRHPSEYGQRGTFGVGFDDAVYVV
jgi:hypothetical protein